jgi:hypothetical protein
MKDFKLIEGIFTELEAQEVILTLLDRKINFHHHKNFMHHEKLGSDCTASLNRIEKLKKNREEMVTYFKEMKDSVNFSIEANVIINTISK